MPFVESEIDPRFYSSDTEAPFDACLVCDVPLLDNNLDYFIERIFRKIPGMSIVEPIFEYAMCMDCVTDLRQRMSKESLSNIEGFLKENLYARAVTANHRENDPLGRCLVTGRDIADCTEYSFHAHCRGRKMIHTVFPFAISDEAMDRMSGLLSEKTIEELDDFKGRFFTGPPEVSKLINPKRLVPL